MCRLWKTFAKKALPKFNRICGTNLPNNADNDSHDIVTQEELKKMLKKVAPHVKVVDLRSSMIQYVTFNTNRYEINQVSALSILQILANAYEEIPRVDGIDVFEIHSAGEGLDFFLPVSIICNCT